MRILHYLADRLLDLAIWIDAPFRADKRKKVKK
jgi:hypothetical protein